MFDDDAIPAPVVLLLALSFTLPLCFMGCEKSKKAASGPPPTVAVPVEVSPADATPIEKSVDAAHTSAVAAKGNLEKALSRPGPESIGDVSTANNQVGSTVAELENAKNVIIPKLKQDLIAETQNRHASESAMKTNQAACDKAVSERDATITELTDKLKKMEDEQIRKAQSIFMWVGILLMLLGVAGPIATFVWQVPFGWKIGALAFPLGTVALTLSSMLPKITWWTEIVLYVLIGGGVLTAVVFGYHLLHHPAPVRKVSNGKPIPSA